MAPYGRQARRFADPGLSGLPADTLPLTRVAYLQNLRSSQPGTLQPRTGVLIASLTTFGLNTGISGIDRLNDPTPFSTIKALRLVGAGTKLFGSDVTRDAYTQIDTGYSGDPLTFVLAAPPQSPRPYAYVLDRSRQRKINSDKVLYPIGLAQPVLPPSVTLAALGVTVISELDTAGAVSAVGSAAAGPSGITRINTTIATILYDVGTTGYATIAATSMANINGGCRVILGAAETVIVNEVVPAVASTTIATIVYDAGTSGLCWIQPVASLGTGQLEAPPLATYFVRQNTSGDPIVTVTPADIAGPLEFGLPPEPPATTVQRIRTVDFPVNGLVTLGVGPETVRILAIAVGPDGVQAFRCSTANTQAAGGTIVGVASFRAFCTTTRAGGDAITKASVENVLTPSVPAGASTVNQVAGIKGSFGVNGALVNGRAVLPDDILHVAVRVSRMDQINSIRLYLDVDASGFGGANVFLDNYFMAEWRASDIAAAIQGQNTATVETITDARTTVVVNEQIDPTLGTAPTNNGSGGTPQA